jgi:radical SAM protein with 4Fe4S-binding SPASM domain
LVEGLAALEIPIRGQFAYGLFAEPLLDPTLLGKATAVRRALPYSRIVMNTNGGPFNARVHEPLTDIIDAVSVHVEAFDPALYAQLMTPLAAERTFPRIAEIARLWRKRAKLAIPVHARNFDQPRALRDWWDSLGGGEVIPLQYSARCSWSPASASLLLWPTPGDCHQEVAEDLIVDFDGKVLVCCHDFARRNVIGDLFREDVAALISNDARRNVYETLRQQEWNRLPSCRDCLVGDVGCLRDGLAKSGQ